MLAANVIGGDLKDNFQCIVDGIRFLLDPRNQAPGYTAGADAANAIPDVEKTLDDLQKVLDNAYVASLVPGFLACAFILLVALTSFIGKSKNNKCCFMSSKCLVFLTLLVILVNFVFYGILMVAGQVASSDTGKDKWAETTETCSSSASEFQTQIDQAQAELTRAENAGYDTTVEQEHLDLAQSQLDNFHTMCTCMSQTLTKFEPMTTPGIVGLLACILALITVDGLCCAMGCCNGKRIAPGGDKMSNTQAMHTQPQSAVAV